MRCRWWGGLLGLGALVSASAAMASPCRMTPVAQVPLHDDGLFLHIPVALDGRMASVLVDTGSEGSLITPEGADRLRLRPDAAHATFMQGPNGRGQLVPNLLVSSMRIGAMDLGAHTMPLGALPGLPAVTPPIMGLIGADAWHGYDLEIDARHGRLTLWAVRLGSAVCRRPPDWPDGYAVLPAFTDGGRLTVAFQLDGRAGRALVDSGARSHIVARRFAHELGIGDDALARDPGGITSGVDLNARRYMWHRFHRLTLGDGAGTTNAANPAWSAPVLTVSDIRDSADMLLGADWFARHDVWLSYSTGQVFVAAPESPPVPLRR